MRIHLTSLISEPEPSPTPALTLLIVLLVTAALASGIAQIAGLL